jgi:hypothetical protein
VKTKGHRRKLTSVNGMDGDLFVDLGNSRSCHVQGVEGDVMRIKS